MYSGVAAGAASASGAKPAALGASGVAAGAAGSSRAMAAALEASGLQSMG